MCMMWNQPVLDSVSERILLTNQDGKALAYNSAALTMLGATLAPEWEGHAREDRQVLERRDGSVIERFTKPLVGIGQLYVLRDVTEERRANAALLDLQHIIATMRQGFATVSHTSVKIESVNLAMAGLHGYNAEELIGVPAVNL